MAQGHSSGEVRPQRLLCQGRYEIREPIGIGGTATVFRAYDRRLGAQRALKVLHPFAAEDPIAVSRFCDEARTMARLEHPNILRVYDLGQDGGHWYCVMELVPDNLAARIERVGRVAPLIALRWTFEVLLALDAAHRSGVVHRDVRPANVLLGADDTARLADFGIARLRQRVTGVTITGESLGCRAWSAPEQFDDPRQVGPQADLFGAGALLLHLITGRLPDGQLDGSLPGVPPMCREPLLYALTREPRDRWPNAAGMIESVARSHDALAAGTGEPPRGELWLERLRAQRVALGEG